MLLLPPILPLPLSCFNAAAAATAAISVSHLAHLVLQAQPLVEGLAAYDHLHRDAGLAHVLSAHNVRILHSSKTAAQQQWGFK
jgi:hypothetical protein